MKRIYIIRHANKDKETGELTEEGRKRASELKNRIGKFDIVITSDKNKRLLDTAILVTGETPKLDKRTGVVYESEEQHEKVGKLAKTHPLNHAGVIYEFPEYEKL